MITHPSFEISGPMIAFICLAAVLVGALLIVMHLRHKYHPSLIGALIGAVLCFVLLEALPALT
jgi:O-antigen/teichoic acid export membrane protein